MLSNVSNVMQVAEELSRVAPIYLLRPSCVPWTGGVISLAAVVERLKDLLPPTFEDLNTVRSHTVPLGLPDSCPSLQPCCHLALACSTSVANSIVSSK